MRNLPRDRQLLLGWAKCKTGVPFINTSIFSFTWPFTIYQAPPQLRDLIYYTRSRSLQRWLLGDFLHSQTSVAIAYSILTFKLKKNICTHTCKCVCMYICTYGRHNTTSPCVTVCGPYPGSHKAQGENGLRFENSRVATDASILKDLEVFTLSRGVGMFLGFPLMSLILRQDGKVGQPLFMQSL